MNAPGQPTRYKAELPPDTQACIFWLRHRWRENWGGRVDASDDGMDKIALLDAASEQARFE